MGLPFGASAELVVNPDRESGVYRAGDVVRGTVEWAGDSSPPEAATYVFKLGGLVEVSQGSLEMENGVAHLEAKIDTPNTFGWVTQTGPPKRLVWMG